MKAAVCRAPARRGRSGHVTAVAGGWVCVMTPPRDSLASSYRGRGHDWSEATELYSKSVLSDPTAQAGQREHAQLPKHIYLWVSREFKKEQIISLENILFHILNPWSKESSFRWGSCITQGLHSSSLPPRAPRMEKWVSVSLSFLICKSGILPTSY